MKEIFQSKIFWITSIVFSTMFFLIGINYNRLYVGEVEILVLPKSNRVVLNLNQLMTTIEKIPASLNFYDKLLKNNEDVEDVVSEETGAEKKTAWNAMFTVARVENSSIVRIDSYSNSQLQAEVLSMGIAKQIAVSMSQYYDIWNDLEIRILDEPIVFDKDRTTDPWIIIPSLLGGLLLGVLFSVVRENYLEKSAPTLRSVMRNRKSMSSEKVAEKKEGAIDPGSSILNKKFSEQIVRTKKAEPVVEKKPETKSVSVEENIFVKKVLSKENIVVASGIKKASAPDNLPVGEDFILKNLKIVEAKRAEAEAKIEADVKLALEKKVLGVPRSHEATEEEIKNRLNKLLGGSK